MSDEHLPAPRPPGGGTTAMKQFFFETQPWHLEREGLDAALAAMAGQIGVDGMQLQVAAVGHAALCSRGPAGPHVDAPDAGLQFQPDGTKLTGSRLRPRVAGWVKSRNPLEAACKAARRHGLAVRAALAFDLPLSDRSPTATIINALGDVSPRALCRAHPDTRELLGALVEDVSNAYPIDVLELEAPSPCDAAAAFGIARLPTSSPGGGLLAGLLGWCFCPSCRQQAQAAGLDAAALQRRATQLITEAIESNEAADRSLSQALADEADLAAYERWQREAALSLVKHLRSRCRAVLSLRVTAAPHGMAAVDAFARWRPAVERMSAGLSCERQAATLEAIGELAGAATEAMAQTTGPAATGEDGAAFDLLLPGHPPGLVDGPHAVSLAHAAAQTSCKAIVFQDFGTAPARCLDWARQAIRYARRESK